MSSGELTRLREAWHAAAGDPVTVSELAHRSGVGRSTLFAWLSGSAAPTAAAWRDVAVALAADPVALWLAAGGRDRGPVWAARLRRGWSCDALAERSGVSRRTVLAVEDGRPVRVDAAARMAIALDEPLLAAQLGAQARRVTAVGAVLEQSRAAHGEPLREFAARLGVSRQMLSAWISGAATLPESRVTQVAAVALVPDAVVDCARALDATRTA